MTEPPITRHNLRSEAFMDKICHDLRGSREAGMASVDCPRYSIWYIDDKGWGREEWGIGD